MFEAYYMLVSSGCLNLPGRAGRLCPGDSECLPDRPCLEVSNGVSTAKESSSSPWTVE